MAENKIYAVLTDRGAQLEAAALASGVPVVLNKFVIGDANGNDDVTPDPARTALIHETYRGDIKSAENRGNQVIFTLYVPPDTGGYTIREVGILTDKGELYSVARSPDILKPTDSNGALISITYKYTLAVSSTSTVNVVVYDNYVTPEEADKKYLQISKNLSEIPANGETAQQAARKNIGIDGDVAYRDKGNAFTHPNTFKDDVIFEDVLSSKKQININKPGTDLTLFSFAGLSDVSGDYLDFSTRGENNQKVFYRLRGVHYDGLVLLCGGQTYKYWNEANLKPVKTINGESPDENGNIDISLSPDPSPEIGVVGAVGTYALVAINHAPQILPGSIWAGGDLYYASINNTGSYNTDIATKPFYDTPLIGSWRAMAYSPGGVGDIGTACFLAIRIA
ncbi:TPA: phage tail protein [Escherichia coli]|nr:phage tail protein [Escherichia coli]HDZ8237614.1 phage tail protein [Escherichia coli]